MNLVLASKNKKKVGELSQLLAPLSIEVLSLADFPQIGEIEESGKTFKENAYIKAKTVSDITGLITMADDSGLQVDVLNGAPGVYSARYAGAQGDDAANNRKLLSELQEVTMEKRSARFICVIAIVVPAKEDTAEQVYYTEGTCEGKIGVAEKGTGGFGYDPLFIVSEFNKTMAELTSEEKNKISHRGQAVSSAIQILEGLG